MSVHPSVWPGTISSANAEDAALAYEAAAREIGRPRANLNIPADVAPAAGRRR